MKENAPNDRRRRPGRLRIALGLCLLAGVLAWFARRTAPHSDVPETSSRQQASAADSMAKVPTVRGRADPPTGRPAARVSGARRLAVRRVIPYGPGEGELGMVHNPEQSPLGPESFTVAHNGNILVADTLNQRIQVFAPDGTPLRRVPTPGVHPGDVMTDGQDRLFVYDQISRALLQYNASGALQATLQLQPTDMDTRGYFHLVGDAVYFADAAARDMLVATLKDGLLASPDPTITRLTDGIHAESGRIYAVAVAKAESLRLQVRGPGSSAAAREVQFAMPDILSASFAGEDLSGCFYVQTERLAAGKVTLEVLAFSPAGELLSTTLLPENDYTLWTAKLMDVTAAGDIVQFLPGRNEARLNIFSEQVQ